MCLSFPFARVRTIPYSQVKNSILFTIEPQSLTHILCTMDIQTSVEKIALWDGCYVDPCDRTNNLSQPHLIPMSILINPSMLPTARELVWGQSPIEALWTDSPARYQHGRGNIMVEEGKGKLRAWTPTNTTWKEKNKIKRIIIETCA